MRYSIFILILLCASDFTLAQICGWLGISGNLPSDSGIIGLSDVHFIGMKVGFHLALEQKYTVQLISKDR